MTVIQIFSPAVRPAAPPAPAVGYCRIPRTQGGGRAWPGAGQFETGGWHRGGVAGAAQGDVQQPGDAESWLGENWRELLDGGVDQVRLLEEEGSNTARELASARLTPHWRSGRPRVGYAPMSLRPPG